MTASTRENIFDGLIFAFYVASSIYLFLISLGIMQVPESAVFSDTTTRWACGIVATVLLVVATRGSRYLFVRIKEDLEDSQTEKE